MDIQIIVDPRAALKDLKEIREDQIPYALAKAINATTLDVQKAEYAHQSRIFTLRRPEWVKRSNKITKFAKKTDPVAIIGIHPPGGDARADIVGKFETETQKTPRGSSIAIPVSERVKRSNAGIIAKRARPAAYNFRQVGKAIRGDKGTFIIKKPGGTGLILQRVKGGVIGRRSYQPRYFTAAGSGGRRVTMRKTQRSTSVHALFLLVPRVRLTNNLHFEATAISVVERKFGEHMVREFNKAMASAR